jgi:hypothetical protein
MTHCDIYCYNICFKMSLCLIYVKNKNKFTYGSTIMRLKITKMLIPCISIAILSGCVSSPKQELVVLGNADESALKELMNVSIEARDEMRLLAKAQEALAQKEMTLAQHEQRYIQATNIPEGFEVLGTFKFAGKASKAAEALAMVTGYKYMPDGPVFANEPWVHINIVDQPFNEALKELGLQTGDSIRIELHAKVMRFIYKTQ